MDFEENYPDSVMKLYTEWPYLAAFIEANLSQKDKEAKEESLTAGKN